MKTLLTNSFLLAFLLTSNLSFAESYPIGRIFTSEEERRNLDRARDKGENLHEQSGPEVSKLATTVYKRIKFSGYLLDEAGNSVVWVNGKSEVTGKPKDIITSKPRPMRSDINIIHKGKRERLKPGQAWLIDKGHVKEAYEIALPTSAKSSSTEISSASETEKDKKGLKKNQNENGEQKEVTSDQTTQKALKVIKALQALEEAEKE